MASDRIFAGYPAVMTNSFINRIRIRDFFRLIRVQNLLIIILTQYLAVLFLLGTKDDWRERLTDPSLLLLALVTTLIAAGGYVINDYYDIRIDYVNKPERVVVSRTFKRREAMALHLVLSGMGMALGFYLHTCVGLIAAFSAALLWIYSVTLKKKPLIGNLVVAFLTSMTLILPAIYYQAQEILFYLYAFFAFGITLVREIIKDLEDVKGDAESGRQTLPVVLGFRRSKWIVNSIIVVFIAGLVAFYLYIGEPIPDLLFIFYIVPLIALIWSLSRSTTKKHFSRLSVFCKILMLGGIFSMIFF